MAVSYGNGNLYQKKDGSAPALPPQTQNITAYLPQTGGVKTNEAFNEGSKVTGPNVLANTRPSKDSNTSQEYGIVNGIRRKSETGGQIL